MCVCVRGWGGSGASVSTASALSCTDVVALSGAPKPRSAQLGASCSLALASARLTGPFDECSASPGFKTIGDRRPIPKCRLVPIPHANSGLEVDPCELRRHLLFFFTGAVVYFLLPPTFRQPAIQPSSQPGYEHIAGPEGSRVDNLRSVHMAEQGASEEDWHAETKQVYDSEARAVKGEFLLQVNAVFFFFLEQTGAQSFSPGNICTARV